MVCEVLTLGQLPERAGELAVRQAGLGPWFVAWAWGWKHSAAGRGASAPEVHPEETAAASVLAPWPGSWSGRNWLLLVLELGSPSPRRLQGWSLVSPTSWLAGGHFVTVFTGWPESALESLLRRVPGLGDQVPALTSPFDSLTSVKAQLQSRGAGQGLPVELGVTRFGGQQL